MTPNSVVFKKDDRCTYNGMVLWQEKYGILKKSYLFCLCLVINIFGAVLSFLSMYFEEDFDLIGTILFVILEVFVFSFMTVRIVKGRIVPEMIRNSSGSLGTQDNKTEVTLRDEDFEIKTPYRRTNYFYDEVYDYFNMGSYIVLVIDKHVEPIIVPLNNLLEGRKEEFSLLLNEKLKGKTKGEGR